MNNDARLSLFDEHLPVALTPAPTTQCSPQTLLSQVGGTDQDDGASTRAKPRLVHPGVRGRVIGNFKRDMAEKLSGKLSSTFDKFENVVTRAVAQQKLDQWRSSHLTRIHIEKEDSGMPASSSGNVSYPNWEEAVDVYDREVS